MGYTPKSRFPMLFESLFYKCSILFWRWYKAPCIFHLPRTKIFVSTAWSMWAAHRGVPQVFPSLHEREISNSRLCLLPGNRFNTCPSQGYLWEAHLQVDSEGPSRLQRDPLNCLGVLQAPLFPTPSSESLIPGLHPTSIPTRYCFWVYFWINLLSASLWFRICFPGHLI